LGEIKLAAVTRIVHDEKVERGSGGKGTGARCPFVGRAELYYKGSEKENFCK